ncbi:MAG: hypothetical protein DLM54_12395 [Acidimicrobiales bacterium]|nr:MAG: hypothetical protein DLM54_12395 [Acidimicrobiales bacterium]
MILDPPGFTISFRPPLDLATSLAGLSRGGDDLLDRWDGTTMVRTMRIEGRPVAFSATPAPSPTPPASALLVVIESPAPRTARDSIAGAVGSMFVQDEDALSGLISIDPVIAGIAAAAPGLRPVLWTDPFSALVRSISAQQVNLAWAAVTRARLASNFGRRHRVGSSSVYSLDPGRLSAAQLEELRALQLSGAKAASLIGLAKAVVEGELDMAPLQNLSDDEVVERLTRLRGVGRWSADWFLARTLGRPRVVAGDLGVRKAVGAAYLDGRLPSELEVRQVTAHWGPAAGMAQQLLLSTAAASTRGRLREP